MNVNQLTYLSGIIPYALRVPYTPTGDEVEKSREAAESRLKRRVEEERKTVPVIYSLHGKTVRRDEPGSNLNILA